MNNMNIIEIWTDGSFRAKKGGFSFYINAPCILEKPILVYSFVKAKKSTQVEILSIINAIKYLYYLKVDIQDCHIKIMCDELSIVGIFNDKKYLKWQEKGWIKGNGKAIVSSVNEWFYLTCLFESIPEGNIEFIKVVSKKDKGNKLVDKYSYYAMNQKLLEGHFVILEYCKINDRFIEKEVLDNIDSNISRSILSKENPWVKLEQAKRVNWQYNKEDIVYIDSSKIIIREDIHLDCQQLQFNGMIRRILESGEIKVPLAVRNDGELYILISGITKLIAAKLLNLSQIPCIVLDFTHEEFIKENTKIIER